MKFDIDSARKAGYSDDEIADYLATENKFDLSGAIESGYSARDVIDFLSQPKGGKQDLPADVTPSAGRSATPMGQADPRIVDNRGIIQRVADYLKPAPKSVMEGYVPTAEEQQADASRRLSYGAGPISSQTAAAADLVRSGMAKTDSPTVKKVANAMEEQGTKSFGDLVAAAKNPVNERAARDAKAEEFRTPGEWAVDTLSNISQGAVGLVQLPINIIAPSSGVAEILRETQKELQASESDVLRASREQLKERVLNEEGFFDKYVATVKQLVTDPTIAASEFAKQVPNFLGIVGAARAGGALLGGAVSAAGRVSPTLALGEAISGGAIQAGARAAGVTAGGAGASMIMAGGDAAGSVYETLTSKDPEVLAAWKKNADYQRLLADKIESGMDRKDASREAIEELATTKARMAALITAPLGLLGYAGAEAAIASKGLGKATAEALTPRGMAKSAAKELGGEQLEEGGTQFGGNVVARTVNPNQSLTEGVPEAMGTALVTSAPFAAAGIRSQYKEAMQGTEDQTIAGRVADMIIGQEQADPRLTNPMDTVRAEDQVGPNAPVRTAQLMNFTEPGSATDQAGLTPVVVPVPTATETTDVSTTGVAGRATAAGGQLAGDLAGAGVGNAGLAGVNPAGTDGASASGLAPLGGATAPVGVGAGQRAATVGLQRPLPRATDADLLARTEAAIAAQENNNADTSLQPWAGRSKIGYSTEQDAEQAKATASVVLDTKDTHEWRVEKMASGRFQLVPYFKESTLGNQAPQAVQAEAQGQEAAAGASAVAASRAAAAPAQLQDRGVPRLTIAPTAPIRDFGTFQKAVAADGIEIAPVRVSEMNDTHKLASVVARLLGKTYTVARVTSGDPRMLSNGMIDKLGGKHIVAAENSEDAPLFVAMHEAYHGLPADKRKALNAQLLQIFRAENKQRFLTEFNYTEAQFEEEAPAFMAQVITKRADFWEELRDKMGNKEFGEVAKIILDTLNTLLRKVSGQYGKDFADTYISDIVKARDLLTTAYAEAMQAQGQTISAEADSGVVASNKSEIGAKLQERVDNDFDALVAEYSALPGTDGGRKLDTDIARELSPEYRADRTRSPEVHEAASVFIEKLFYQRVQARTSGTVAFMAGGGGAGKSSAEALVDDKLSKAHTILDGTLSSPDKAARLIGAVVANGQNAVVTYIYRDPAEAVTNGVLKRAMRTGRVVPIYSLVKTHSGASETVRMLQEAYGNDDRFKLFVVDNSRGPGNAALVDLSSITPVIKSGLKERLYEATQQAYDDGRISRAVYDATVAEGQPDTRAEAQGQARAAADRQGDEGSVQGRSGSERAGNPVSKDEAVVDGVVYSSKRRNLVDIPTIEFKDLVGKKVVGIKADLTDAGRSYTGIDGSQLEFPVEMMGGPNYVRLPENAKANVVWAVRGGATLTKILSQVNKADYVLVHAMNGNSHLTNSTISTAYLQTVEAYLRDGRISRENLLALDEIVRSPKNKSGLPDFPGFESPEIYSYIDGLSFDQRGALAQILEKKEAQAHGLPNLERFRRETIDPDFAGYRQGDAMLVIKVDKENPTVKLGEEGTKLHPSYPLGLRGTVIGKLSKGVNYEMIFRDYFKFAVPNFKNGEAGAWYAFDRKMPIQKITKEIAESVAPGGYSSIKTARQAEAALAMANGNWLVSGKTKAQGGISVQEFVDALRANDGAAALTLYTADEVKAGIKDKSFTIYQLGNQGGDKGLQVFFGLKRGAPWYKDMIDGVSDNEVEVVSVTNNEAGAPGIGIPAIITKAISEGATVLDAFAVKSDRFPSGFLPEMYAQFGFEEIGRIPFDPSYYDATQMADLKAFWSKGGWNESDGFPDVVVMRWKGNDEDRATAVERYVRSGDTGVSAQAPRYTRAAAGEPDQLSDSPRRAKGRAGRGDAVAPRGNQGAGDAASVVTRAFSSIRELATLGDGDIRNLGLDPAEVQRLRDELAGVQRSNRPAELARGPGARPDAGDGSTFTGIHYGKAAGLRFLSGTSFGTGIKGAEQARLAEPGVDPRIKKRVYFYLTNNNADMPRPEIGLGSHVYRATLGNLYDPSKASPEAAKRVKALMQGAGPNAFESAVLDAGYRGYVNREQGTAVVLNADVPVAYEGMADASRMRDRVIERVQQGPVTRTEGDELVRRPSSDEMGGIIKARPALAAAAPSFKLQFGEARVLASEAAEADRVLADAGAAFQFGEVMRSNRVTETTDSGSPDIRRSNKRQKLVGTSFTMESSSATDAARIKLQDDALRMKRVIEAVKNKGGVVTESQNFYDANTLMPGRIQAAIDDFKTDVVKPMLDKAAEYGIDMDELAAYAYAKHAKERNAYIAGINKRMPDGGSGMTNDEADNILQMVNLAGDTAKFEELHQTLMGITSATRQIMLTEGLITNDEFNQLEGAYDNYIPLRGFENVDEETGVARPGIGRGINVRGGETIRALGRKSKAGDLIENVIRDYERVIMRVEKNDVGKVLLDFVLSNPDPDLWGVDVERNKASFNKALGTVQYTKAVDKGEDTIGIKVGGEQVYIKFADKELARALRQAWKDETSGLERATLAMTGWWNNWMRAVLTKYNPAFAAINIPRDALWSGTAAALDDLGAKGLGLYLKNYGKALMASSRQELGVSGSTNPVFGNPQVDRMFQEFRAAGGITGGFYMRSLKDINQELRNELLLAGASARNPWESIKSLPPFKLAKLTLKTLQFMGAASENATRFALYMTSREMGNTPTKAALLAKDGTTNFNRKGEWGGALNNLYLFFNAGVQGTAQLVKVLKNPKVQVAMAGVSGVGMMLALYGASAGGEDDDGEKYWDKIPSYVKERNLVIMLPPGDALAGGIDRVGKRGRYVTIPVQYGFNIFPNLGYMIADVLRNAEDKRRGVTPTKAALHMTSVVFGSVNPFGGSVDVTDGVQVLLAVSPTLTDLPLQLVNERGTFGNPSAPSKSPWDKRPDSERMFVSQQDTVPARIAKAINELGGGNEGKAGSIMGVETSVTPGTIQTLISATTGGLGSFVEQIGSSVMAMTGEGKDLKANKIPFVNRFYGEVDESANIRSAAERMAQIRKLSDEVKAQQKVGLNPELKDDEQKLMALAGMQDSYQRQQAQMRKAELEIIKDSKLTDAQKTLERRRIEVERDKLATEVNRAYLQATK